MGENFSIFKKGLVLVAIPVVFQLGFIALMVQMRQESREDYRWSSQTKVVLAEIESTFRRLVEAHSDMRGYVITGEPAFAQAYDHAVAVLPGAIGKLRSLVRDPGQQERLARIEQRSARLLGFLGELKWLMETGAQGKAVAAVKSLTGKEPMDALGEAIGAFLNREDALDAEYYAALERAWRQEEYFLMAGLMLSLIFAVGTAYVFSYGISRRLGILMRNIECLGVGEGEESLAPLGGRDEIGQMDGAFQQMARALARRTTALTVSNQELQNFAAVASHDLQEPLRKIEVFGSRLAAKSADTLDSQGREYLERMLAAARRMRTLITDLLTFARVDNQGPALRPHRSHASRAGGVHRSRGTYRGKQRPGGTRLLADRGGRSLADAPVAAESYRQRLKVPSAWGACLGPGRGQAPRCHLVRRGRTNPFHPL
jgi:CHASE3 domain sensor protein